jgi:hypothetical protein
LANAPRDLTTIELIVLHYADGDNTLGIAYGAVQLHAFFQLEEELLDATQNAFLRLFDLGLLRFVRAAPDVGYTATRFELPEMTRDELVAASMSIEVTPPETGPTFGTTRPRRARLSGARGRRRHQMPSRSHSAASSVRGLTGESRTAACNAGRSITRLSSSA